MTWTELKAAKAVQSTAHKPNNTTVLARLYAPPFCIIVRRKKKGGGRLIEVCTNAPRLRPPPPHPILQSGFRVTIMLLHGSCRASWLPQNNNYYSTQLSTQQLQARDGRIVGHVPVPLALARTFWYTARLPAE